MNNTYLHNKYTRWYYNIIQQAQSRSLPTNDYVEKHHILPKSLGGNNTNSNIVKLTPREHFICHLLLTKMTSGNAMYKMQHALWMLTNVKKIGKGRYAPTSRIYEYVRKSHNIAIKNTWTEEKRKNHSEKLKKYNAQANRNSNEYIARNEKIREYQLNKTWTKKAILTRLENCLSNARKRKGKSWSDKMRQGRQKAYVIKHRELAEKIFQLYDSGFNKRQISLKLNVTWDAVHYPLLHREWFQTINTQ